MWNTSRMAFDKNRVIVPVVHKGVKVFLNDLTACATPADVMQAIDAMLANALAQPGNMRSVTDITNVIIDTAAMDRANKLGKEVFNAKALRTAIVGVTGYKKILLRTFSFFSGMAPVPFDTREAALDYVVRDD